MAMNRNSILEAMKLKTETVMLGDETVIVSEIGASDYIKLWTDPKNQKVVGDQIVNGVTVPKTEVDMSRFTPALIAYAVVDEAGNRVFGDDDIEVLARSSQGPFMKLAEVVRKLNGLTGEEVKNSEDSQLELPSIASA